MLKEKIEDKDFNYQVVKSGRWNLSSFRTHNGDEHILQSELNEFGQKLFFNGKPIIFT